MIGCSCRIVGLSVNNIVSQCCDGSSTAVMAFVDIFCCGNS